MLVKSESNCREANAAETAEFYHSTCEDDGKRFDIYLSLGDDSAHAYVFLAPCELRVTGQVKPDVMLTPS